MEDAEVITMEMRSVYFTILLVSIVLLGSASFIGGMSVQYSKPTTINSTITYISQEQNVSRAFVDTTNNLTTTKVQPGTVLDLVGSLITGVFGIIKSFATVADVASTMMTGFTNLLGLPQWIGGIVILFVIGFVMFELISILMKYKA